MRQSKERRSFTTGRLSSTLKNSNMPYKIRRCMICRRMQSDRKNMKSIKRRLKNSRGALKRFEITILVVAHDLALPKTLLCQVVWKTTSQVSIFRVPCKTKKNLRFKKRLNVTRKRCSVPFLISLGNSKSKGQICNTKVSNLEIE